MNEDNFQEKIELILHDLKFGKNIPTPASSSALLLSGEKMSMYTITTALLNQDKIISILAQWRDKNNIWFPAQFRVTFDGTKKWAKEQLLDKRDRILFFLQAEKSKDPFGHIGLYRFNYTEKSCEIDNVIRGIESKETRGGMTIGLQLLIDWTYTYLKVERLYLQVFSDNEKAISLYKRVGFEEVERTPLRKKIENDVVSWVEYEKDDGFIAKRYHIKMALKKRGKKYA